MSEALSKETIDVRGFNRTKGKTPSTSENNSILGRELMQQNEIASMPIDYNETNNFNVSNVYTVTFQKTTENCTQENYEKIETKIETIVIRG